MSDIQFALALDLVTVTCSIVALVRLGRIGHSHPASIYLFFHLTIVTLRLVALVFADSPTLFSGFGSQFAAVGPDELARAAFIADLALVMMSAGSIKAARDDVARLITTQRRPPGPVRLLSIKKIWIMVALTAPLGVFILLNNAMVPGSESYVRVDPREWAGSSWFLLPRTWPGLGLLALIYWYGFAWWLIAPMSLYLLLMVYQGLHRFRVVLPILMMVQIYLDRRRQRWPSAGMAVLLVTAVLVFFPMKTIGRMMQQGESLSSIASRSGEIVSNALSGRVADQLILDQLASGLSLSDAGGHLYLGRTYLALVTLPVPRPLWPEKPGLADHIEELSTAQRPMAKAGMVLTYLGEAYVNFGWFGILLIPTAIGYGLSRFYFVAYRAPYLSVLRFAYLITACSLIQVYRDGLVSLFVFTFVHMMPLVLLVLLHRRRSRWSAPAGETRPTVLAPAGRMARGRPGPATPVAR
jgi:hypothetical protein